MNRREALKSLGSGASLGLTGAVIVATTSCAPTEAPAAVHDPLVEAITAYRTERDAAYAIPLEDQKDAAFDEAYDGRVLPLFFRIKDITPTTMAGVLLALQFLKEENEDGPSVLSESLINGVTTFLEGRAA